MNDLKCIWNELGQNIDKSFDVDFKVRNSIIDNFRKEVALRKRYNPLVFLFIIILAVVFFFIVRGEENAMSAAKYIGIALVVLSGVVIVYFAQRVKAPLKNLDLDHSATAFAQMCRDYLIKARFNLGIGALLQCICLSIGLYLIIFFENSSADFGLLGAFWGFMGGLCGCAIGGSIAAFNKHYKSLFEITNQFTEGN